MLRTISINTVALLLFLWLSAADARATFAPSDLTNLAFWFSPETLDDTTSHNPQYTNGQSITVWDNSSLTSNPTRDANGSGTPTYLDATNGINGHSAVHFSGNGFLDVTHTFVGTADSVFVVFRTTSTDAARGYSGNAAQNMLGDRTNLVVWNVGVTAGNAEYNIYNGTGPDNGWSHDTGGVVNSGRAHSISVTRNVSSVTMSTDGGTPSSTTYPGAGFDDYFNTIGGGYLNGSGVGDFFTGDIAEIIIYNRSLTTTEYNSVNAYLVEKFAVPEPACTAAPALAALALATRRRRG